LYRIIDECVSKSSLTKPSSVFNNIKKEKKRRFIYLFIYWVGGGGDLSLCARRVASFTLLACF